MSRGMYEFNESFTPCYTSKARAENERVRQTSVTYSCSPSCETISDNSSSSLYQDLAILAHLIHFHSSFTRLAAAAGSREKERFEFLMSYEIALY
jgi:hypothetical protein